MTQLGKLMVIGGVIIAVLGLLIWLLGDKLHWFGNLPGDIKIEKERYRIYIPIASMLILGIVISFVFWLIRKFIN